MLEYPERRLETRVKSECGYCGLTGTCTIAGDATPRQKIATAYARNRLLTMLPSQFLFLEPNASDPLNKEAAEDLRQNREGFKRSVRTSMSGGVVKGESYERVIK